MVSINSGKYSRGVRLDGYGVLLSFMGMLVVNFVDQRGRIVRGNS